MIPAFLLGARRSPGPLIADKASLPDFPHAPPRFESTLSAHHVTAALALRARLDPNRPSHPPNQVANQNSRNSQSLFHHIAKTKAKLISISPKRCLSSFVRLDPAPHAIKRSARLRIQGLDPLFRRIVMSPDVPSTGNKRMLDLRISSLAEPQTCIFGFLFPSPFSFPFPRLAWVKQLGKKARRSSAQHRA